MIYVRGDTHGLLNEFTEEKMPGISSITADDILLIAGDFGFVMYGEENDENEKQNLDAISLFPFTILFIDGNHEGYPHLNQYPLEIHFGAPVRRLRSNIFWLQRGYIYTIENLTFFVMGGAYSMDKARRLAYQEQHGIPIWFKEELPSPEEYKRAAVALAEQNYAVDYILTHTAPVSIIPRLIGTYPDTHDRELTGFLDWIYHDITFKRWYFGHFHEDRDINEKITACFRQIHTVNHSF